MIDYEVKTREELSNCIVNFWYNLSEYNYDTLYSEVYDNLGTKEGIERELDVIRDMFDTGYKENEELDNLWNYVNWYKTEFYKKESAEE